MVVPESSATLEYPGEIRVGLNGNHLTIAKYGSKNETNFATVATTLHKLIGEISREAEAEPGISAP